MESSLPIESPFSTSHAYPKARSLVSIRATCLRKTFHKSAGTDLASALHFEAIFVDFETLDFRIERSRGQP